MSGTSFPEAVLERSRQLGLAVPPSLIHQLERYYQLLARWNRRINLTALPLEGFPAATLDRLIFEPFVAATALGINRGRWFDIGSGGGSPAVPMRLLSPSVDLSMVEPKGRKVAFLREVVRALELDRADVIPSLVEDLDQTFRATADLVTIRAVRIDDRLLTALKLLVHPAGQLLCFGDQSGTLSGFEQVRVVPLPGNSTLGFYRPTQARTGS